MGELRDYQTTALDEIRQAVAAGDRRIMLQMPTGAGKTRLAAEMVDGARGKKKRVVFTVPAISLIDQTVEAFYAEGIREIGVIQANHAMTDWTKDIQVASVQTLLRRELPQADVVIQDEAHRLYKVMLDWTTRAPEIPFIGLSATPWTKGLGRVYTRLIVATTTQQLIDGGWLVPFRVFAPSHPDLRGVHTVAGDYHEGELSKVMQQAKLIADIIETWKTKAGGRPTICFAVDRAHAATLQQRFEAAGISAAYMDCTTPLSERQTIRRRFLAGDVKVVCNVEVIGIGVDWPEIACVSYCRPTKSEIRFVQNIGRGLRPSLGKDDLLILDHSDTHLRLGFVTEIAFAGLRKGKEPQARDVSPRLPKECKVCGYLKPYMARECPNCGDATAPPASVREFSEGELRQFNGKRKIGKHEPFTPADKSIFLAELKGYALEHGYKAGWAAVKYKVMFGVWPHHTIQHVAPLRYCSPATLSWIKAQQIAWANSRKREITQDQTQVVDEYNGRVPPWVDEPRANGSGLVDGTLCTERDMDDFLGAKWR